MKVIVILLIFGILFSYIPISPMDECSEGDHMGNIKVDCGYSFHCPIIVDISPLETLNFPLNGRLVLTPPLLIVDELTYRIFRPPKILEQT